MPLGPALAGDPLGTSLRNQSHGGTSSAARSSTKRMGVGFPEASAANRYAIAMLRRPSAKIPLESGVPLP